MPYINKGEWISCENGHRYARALKDIERGTPSMYADFQLEDGTNPTPGTIFPKCQKCGKPFILVNSASFGNVPHIEGRGWLANVGR